MDIGIETGRTWRTQKAGRSILTGILWATVIALAFVLVYSEARRYLVIDSVSYGPFWKNRFFVLAHFIAGSIALLSGPFQFWSGIRKRSHRLHRWTGRIYLASILIGAATAYYMSFNSVVGWMLGVSLGTLSSVWLTCAAMAYVFHSSRSGYGA